MSARRAICLISLALVLTWPLSATEPMTLSRSLRQRILNADRFLQLAEVDLRTVRQQFETQRRLNVESAIDWTARESDWRNDESRLKREISRLKAEKAELERQEQSSEQDLQNLIDLRSRLADERAGGDRARLRGATLALFAGVLVGVVGSALLF